MEKHYPKRGDAIEAWLKEERELIAPTRMAEKYAINRLLDRYRECSDYGLALDEEGGDP